MEMALSSWAYLDQSKVVFNQKKPQSTYAVLSRLVRQPGSGPPAQSSLLCTLLLKKGAAISVSANEFTRDVRMLNGLGVSMENGPSDAEPGN
jgi:hypothetical protein